MVNIARVWLAGIWYLLYEELSDVVVTLEDGEVERRDVLLGAIRDVCTLLHQHLRALREAVVCSHDYCLSDKETHRRCE